MDGSATRLRQRAREHLQALCRGRDRRPGSADNQAAIDYVAAWLSRCGWRVRQPAFEVVAWEGGGGTLTVGGQAVAVHASPYTLGVDGTGPLLVATSLEELAARDLAGAVLLLCAPLTARPLTPKAFPFFQVEEHQRLIACLERAQPTAVVAATGACPEQAGALSPFPFIEDGDFTVPAAHVDERTGAALAAWAGAPARIVLDGRRRLAQARNVIADQGDRQGRVVLMAHVDTKVGTPGALDNAAGVAVLLLVAEALDQQPSGGVELLVLNGEDYYNAAGEVHYLAECGADLSAVALAVNLDGLGYRRGPTAYSLYGCDARQTSLVHHALRAHGLVEGPQWWQSDHALFALHGRPAVALTSALVDVVLREVVHAPHDRPHHVDPSRLVQAAQALTQLVGALDGAPVADAPGPGTATPEGDREAGTGRAGGASWPA
jgi:aminopeptidase YwaD